METKTHVDKGGGSPVLGSTAVRWFNKKLKQLQVETGKENVLVSESCGRGGMTEGEGGI